MKNVETYKGSLEGGVIKSIIKLRTNGESISAKCENGDMPDTETVGEPK